MTFMNVVIGYGIVASVMTTDIDLSKEVVGQGFILWTILTCLIPLFFIWSNTCRYTLLRQLRTRGQRIRNVAVVLLAGLLVWAPIRLMEKQQKGSKKRQAWICQATAAWWLTRICRLTGCRR